MKHIVGVADMCVSDSAEDQLITHALGSCLGIVLYDPIARVGGMLHVMLPSSSIDPTKADANPYMFVDTGVPKLFHTCYKAGARKERLIVKVAGGATARGEEEDFFQIGKRNIVTLRKLLWKNNVICNAFDVGGCISRTMMIELENGLVTLRSGMVVKEL